VVLVDTSVWVDFFRRPARIDLPAVVDLDEVVTCLPVVQEVLQGFRDQAAFTLARESMLALPMVEAPLRQRSSRTHSASTAGRAWPASRCGRRSIA
jgi:predicted nucleic acid-binding protein